MAHIAYLTVLRIACAVVASTAPWAVGDLPDKSAVQQTTAETNAAYAAFMRESMEVRLAYLYGGGFFADAQRRRMTALAAEASAKLQRIGQKQEQICSTIEAYEGPDWDSLYGQTGLWRDIYTECRKTNLLRCRIDLYAATADDDARRIQTAHEVIQRLQDVPDTSDGRLLLAEALWLTGGQAERIQAEQIVDAIVAADDVDASLRCRAILLRLRILGRISASDFRQVAQAVDDGPCKDDFELNVQAAFLELRLDRPERGALLKRAAAKWPQSENAMGRAILAWLDSKNKAGQLDAETIRTPIEASLALKAAYAADPSKYRPVLEHICAAEHLISPLALFVYAEACRNTEPATAIRFYVRAAIAQQEAPDNDIDADDAEMARRAAQLAYKLYFEDDRYMDSARLTLEFYCRTAGEEVDEQLEYLYAKLLGDAGLTSEWRLLCDKIIATGGTYSPDAQLDLIAANLKEHKDQPAVQTAAKELARLIASLDETDDHSRRVKHEAAALYCKLLLERNADGDLQKVLEMLAQMPDGGWTLRVLKAVALDKAGSTEEAVALLANASNTLTCDAAEAVYAILSQAVDRFELYQSRVNDSDLFVDQCLRLAAFCVGCADADGRGRTELLWAETSLFSRGQDRPLDRVEQVLDGQADEHRAEVEWLRCRARLLTARGEDEQAFAAWAELRGILEISESADPDRPWGWWCAKYYELLGFLHADRKNAAKVTHAVDVLEGAYKHIPSPWARKLATLREGLRP